MDCAGTAEKIQEIAAHLTVFFPKYPRRKKTLSYLTK